MSKPPPSNKAYAGCFFSNAFGLPNLASFYLGARASVPPPTTITRMNGLSACLSSKVNTVIQPGLLIVGQNYRFQGTLGSILIELAEPALISGFTLIHPSKCEIPNGYFSSAPKTFTVYGRMAGGGNLANEEALEFGRYTYRDSGPRAQTFPVQSTCVGTELHKSVLVKFEENYGNQNYTSIYKFEVHGLFANKLLERPEARCAECGNTI
ncbi:SUN domain-containing protein 3-like [Folsomia candida]|nr:SUN domain-containing protein 3-like [Folsomia candida]